jgi:crossover junction endodeoxyribonuclease RuvC
MRVIGIDPGYERLGIAVLEKNASEKEGRVLYSDCIKTKPSLPFPDRLRIIGDAFAHAIDTWCPEALAIEKLFFTTNQKTAMGVSEVRGAIIYLARAKNLPVCEYTPSEIKVALTGYGKAEKRQVAAMIALLVRLEPKKRYDDEFDAIAAGLTLIHSGIPIK